MMQLRPIKVSNAGRRPHNAGGSLEQQQERFAAGLQEAMSKPQPTGSKNRAVDPYYPVVKGQKRPTNSREIYSIFLPI